MIFSDSDIDNLPSRYRAQLMNSVTGFKNAQLIGTQDNQGQHNLAIFSSVTHLGSNPPLIGFITRPHTVQRHTLENVRENPFFTLNQVNIDNFEAAHQTAAKYDKGTSEFAATGLTPVIKPRIPAPFVDESHIHIGLKVVDEIGIELNQTVLVIGEVIHLELPVFTLQDDGKIDLHQVDSTCISGLDEYLHPTPLKRMPYAKA